MIFRTAVEADRSSLESFNFGDTSSPWQAEVAEILAGLLVWRDDPDGAAEGREIVVAEDADEVVAVTAYSSLVVGGQVYPSYCYVMVVAVRADHQRNGVAEQLLRTLFARLADRGVEIVEWLVHPSNTASMWFSRQVFPEADELSPPEDKPYVLFVLGL